MNPPHGIACPIPFKPFGRITVKQEAPFREHGRKGLFESPSVRGDLFPCTSFCAATMNLRAAAVYRANTVCLRTDAKSLSKQKAGKLSFPARFLPIRNRL